MLPERDPEKVVLGEGFHNYHFNDRKTIHRQVGLV